MDASPKADVHLAASTGSNRPRADIRLWYNYQGQVSPTYSGRSLFPPLRPQKGQITGIFPFPIGS